MRNTNSRLRDAAAGLFLIAGFSFSSVAHGGQGVWTTNGPYGGEITALAIDPANPATVYAGTNAGVFKSTDSGGTWTAANAGLPNQQVRALAIDPVNPATLYAGTASEGVFRSADAGGTWTAANTGLTGLGVGVLVVNPANPTTLYALSLNNGLFKSTNSGGTWSAIPSPPYAFALTIDPVTPATLYAGTLGPGVFKSTDSGGTWAATGFADPWGYGSANTLAINPIAPATLYVGTDSGVYKSTDSGSTWTDGGLTNFDVLDLAIAPSSTATIYAGTFEGGVFKSTDGGGSWTAISAALPATTVQALAVDPANPATLYAATSVGVFKSSTDGTWLLPSCAHSRGAGGAFYTTNLAVANVGTTPASFTMKFLGHDVDGSDGPEQTFNLESGKSVVYLDVLGTVFHAASDFGAVRITSDTPTLDVISVTSTPGFGGTLSQTIPAVSSTNLIPADSQRSILYIREGDGFRTNLVLASTADVSTAVDVALVSPEGTTLATKVYSVPPNGMTQIDRVVRDMGASGAINGARLVLSSATSGAAFTAFASVIDEVTNDPTAVEAK